MYPKTRRAERTIDVVATAGDWFLLELSQRFPRSSKTDYYLVREISADWGRGFELEKEDGQTVYHVNIDDPGDSCDCRGHTRFGYCKHASGVRALLAARKVPTRPATHGPVAVPYPRPVSSSAN